MNILFYFTYLLFSAINFNICTNDVHKSDVKLSGDDTDLNSYPIKRKVQNYDHSNEEEQDDQNFLNVQPNQRYRRIDDLSITGLSNEGRVIKSLDDRQSQEPYGLVYQKGKLLGILEPYPEVYELSPYSNINENALRADPIEEDVSYLSNRMASFADASDDSERDESSQNDYVKYANDKYPMVLTSFKIDKKLNALNSNKHERKSLREKLKQRHSMRDKYSADDRKEEDANESSSNVDAVEDDLHDVLDNIGLIDENLVKGKRDAEDENLEEGSNKINIVKATHDPVQSEKKKREEEYIEDDADQQFVSKSTAPTASEDDPSADESEPEIKSDVQNYQSEGEDYIRRKRNEDINETIMKGLEKSGELTVSGNKSPLASSENESKTVEKRRDDELDQKTNDNYEKQLELSIHEKINAIKEEVKREIALLQAKAAPEDKSVKELQRKKREVRRTSLPEEQPKMLNPQDDPESFVLPYVRTKRNSEKLNSDGAEESGDEYANEKSDTSDSNYISNSSPKAVDTINSELRQNYTRREDNLPLKQDLEKSRREIGFDSDNLKTQRKRRHINFSRNMPIISYMRRKRGEAVLPYANVAFLPYRPEDDEVDAEGDEFGDDGFDDRSAEMHKRDTDDNEDYQNVAVDYDPANDNYGIDNFQRHPSRKYVSNLNSDVYEDPFQDLIGNNYLYDPSVQLRKKRHNFDELVALHGGGPTVHHLSAVRDRNMRQLQDKGAQYQRSPKIQLAPKEELDNIVGLSDTDLFGALPQSYEGELSRSKRVKRISGI